MLKPVAVLISDVHYSLSTLELADKSFRMAIDKASELKVPLIDCGDLTNDKAILRAEVVNRLIKTMEYASNKCVPVYLIVGNHSLINERGEEHALGFLSPYCDIISSLTQISPYKHLYAIPYYSDSKALQEALNTIPAGSTILMHQGVGGSNMGHYAQDRSALPKESFSDFRVVSGHYHCAQDIKCGRPRKGAIGLFSYVGNPYTLTFGEANDPTKGFCVLMDDGMLQRIPTNLRKHIVLEGEAGKPIKWQKPTPEDLVWVKYTGSQSELIKVNKNTFGNKYIGHTNFKLDLIPTDSTEIKHDDTKPSEADIMDLVIDASGETLEQRVFLKSLWRGLV